jgi:hypothetical protein
MEAAMYNMEKEVPEGIYDVSWLKRISDVEMAYFGGGEMRSDEKQWRKV